MRHPVHIDLELIESWLVEVDAQTESQRNFVKSISKLVANARAKNDLDIVLDVDDDIVLYRRYSDGNEVVAADEAPLYYAQCIALGLCDWDKWK